MKNNNPTLEEMEAAYRHAALLADRLPAPVSLRHARSELVVIMWRSAAAAVAAAVVLALLPLPEASASPYNRLAPTVDIVRTIIEQQP